MRDHSDLIIEYFCYLVNEYHFTIIKKVYDEHAFGNAYVDFMSPKYKVRVVIDRDYVGIDIEDQIDTGKKKFIFTDVIKYYAPEVKTTFEPPQKPAELSQSEYWEQFIESQLASLSKILREYCQPLLRGENWAKDEIEKLQEERVSKMFGEDISRMLKKIG